MTLVFVQISPAENAGRSRTTYSQECRAVSDELRNDIHHSSLVLHVSTVQLQMINTCFNIYSLTSPILLFALGACTSMFYYLRSRAASGTLKVRSREIARFYQ